MENRPYIERLLLSVSLEMMDGGAAKQARYDEILKAIDLLKSPDREDTLVRMLMEQREERSPPPPQMAA